MAQKKRTRQSRRRQQVRRQLLIVLVLIVAVVCAAVSCHQDRAAEILKGEEGECQGKGRDAKAEA